jgi:hypothetical protein
LFELWRNRSTTASLQNAVINLNIFSGIYPLQRVKQKAWLIKAFTWKLQDLIYVVVNLPSQEVCSMAELC